MFAMTKRDWRGQENLPATGGFLACGNHLSHVDPIAFAHYLFDSGREPYFLGKIEVFDVPVVGAILRGARQIPVHRESGRAADAFRSAVEAVREGRCIALYPEGTLTRDPDLWPMVPKTGAAKIALTTRCPVIPIAQWGPEHVLPPYAKRPRLLPRTTMQVRAGRPVDLSDLYDRPMTRTTLVEASDRIVDAITALLEEIRGEKAPAERWDPRAKGQPRTGNPHKARREGGRP